MNAIVAVARLLLFETFRRKDFYVALILMAVILAYAASMDFYEASNVLRYLFDLGLSLVFFFSVILTAALGARQYPAEKEQRTLGVLLAKPVGRWQVVAGKFLGTFAGGAAAFAIFYGLFMGIALLKGGGFAGRVAAETFAAFLFGLGLVAAIATSLSFFVTTSGGVTLTLLLYFLTNAYGPALKGVAGPVLYFVLPHFELFDLRLRLIHAWGPVPAGVLGELALYALLYSLALLTAAWIKFSREQL